MGKPNEHGQNATDQLSVGQLDKADLSNDYIYSQAMAITEAAKNDEIVLRLIGATAFINHCPQYKHLYAETQRKLTDVDLMAYSTTPLDKLDAMFKSLGYDPIRALSWHSTTRDIYVNEDKLYVDVFRDVLSYCHPISFVGRLEMDFPTIPLVDLLLEKLQIVQINAKDLFDIVVLLLEHELGDGREREIIDIHRITNLWAANWGFYYTGTTNLKKAQLFVDDIRALDSSEKKSVQKKVDNLLQRVEKAPKSLRWKLRSKIGTKMKWYEDVESVER